MQAISFFDARWSLAEDESAGHSDRLCKGGGPTSFSNEP